MSYVFDELVKLSKKNPNIFEQAAFELNISYDRIKRWNKREPHERIKPRILDYIRKEKEKQNIGDEKINVKMAQLEITKEQEDPVDVDEYHVPMGFIDQLEIIYLKDTAKGKQEWQNEKAVIVEIVRAIATQLQIDGYKILSPIAHGGTAIIIKIRNVRLGVLRALKFPRPVEGRVSMFQEIIKSEITHLLEATHINIMEVYDANVVNVGAIEYPYYVMNYIEGAQDGIDYFKEHIHDSKDFLSVLRQVVAGIRHLHSLGIAHLDIKPDNFLISPDGRAVLSDLGSARNLSDGDDSVLVVYTRDYAHPELLSNVVSSSTDPNRQKGYLKRSELSFKFDLYALGKSIIRILKHFDPLVTNRMPPYCRKYLDLLACRCLDGRNSAEDPLERAMGLPKLAFEELKYKSVVDINNDLLKLADEWPLDSLIPELDPHYPKTVQATSLWKTPLTDRVVDLMAHPAIQRLSGISQLGLLIQVYPTATHSRLEHALGVFTNTIQYIYSLYNDPINPLFNQIMTETDLKSVMIAALCHDLGHFPLAHDLYECMPDIFDHEVLTTQMLQGKLKLPYEQTLIDIITNAWDVDPQYVVDILQARTSNIDQPIKTRILHTILSGPIDADKLDYLVRDSNNLGVPYANMIDFNRLLSCLTIIFKELEQKLHVALGIHEKGKISAESIAFARYAMFGTVYWHHTSRASVSMLHRVVWELMEAAYASPAAEKLFRSEFIDWFFRPERVLALQLGLPSDDDGNLSQLTQLSLSDFDLLNWLYKKSKTVIPHAAILLKLINERHLFKRVLVVSQQKNGPLWNKLIKFRRNATPKEILAFQKEVQRRIVDTVRKVDDDLRRTYSILTPENTDQIVHLDHIGEIIVTVDIPLSRPGATVGLEYLPEADRQDVMQQWNLPHSLEDSTIWTELNDNFIESVGKIRLFGQYDIATIIPMGPKTHVLASILVAMRFREIACLRVSGAPTSADVKPTGEISATRVFFKSDY